MIMNLNFLQQEWLINHNLTQEDIWSFLTQLSEKGLDYGDLYFQSIINENWYLENSIIKNGFYNFDNGVGIRAIIADKIGFSYTDKIELDKLTECIQLSSTIVDSKEKRIYHSLKNNFEKKFESQKSYYQAINPLKNFTKEEKLTLLNNINKVARAEDKRVQEVSAVLSGTYEHIFIAATDGTLAIDIRPLVQLSINVLVEEKGKRESGSCGVSGRFGYDVFLLKEANGEICAEYWTREAVRMAIVNLSAIAAPAGMLPVVLGAGWPGVLLHEAVGHGLEGDFIRHKSSIYTGKIGEKVASDLCTIVDDGTLNGLRGSLTIDDEGIPGQYTTLIKNGVLKGYMHDKMSARMLNMQPTGNGRRESYAYLPMPRMTNTYMLPGNYTSKDIISSIEYGIYAPNIAGGQVDITSGNFVFSTAEAWLIEKGCVTKPVKGATLIGSGSEIMQKISMVGNDLVLDKGTGICSKEGQNIPVGVGQPTLKLDSITVGGTN